MRSMDGRGRGSRAARLLPLWVLALALLSLASGAPAGAETGCALAGSWNQSTEEVGSTTWVIEANGTAQEHGIGNAEGDATLSNDT